MATILEIFAGIAAVVILLYYYLTSTFNFWKNRGVKGPKPIPLFGNIKDVMLQRKSMSQFLIELCSKYRNEPYIGVFYRTTPVLILTDPLLLKDVLIKDFSSFNQRFHHVYSKVEPLSHNLLFFPGQQWKLWRKKLSPAFTSGKLKEMFPLIMECSKHLAQYLHKLPENDLVEIRELAAKFTTNVVSSCVFGIEMNAPTNEESDFRKMGKELFKFTFVGRLIFLLREYYPKFYGKLGFLFHNTRQTSFFVNIVKQTIEHRIKNNIVRHDLINILKELKENHKKLDDDFDPTDVMCASQAFSFFVAGFETSSSTMTNALYELAQNHEAQDKLRKEIREEFEKNNGTLRYESIKSMTYLHAVFQETLRKYPIAMVVHRQCVAQSYTFEGTKLTIPKDQDIIIPTIGIHHNPNIYPNPDVFDPERFLVGNNLISETTYLPFGRGPRNCIGEKFGSIQTKIGIITFLRDYKLCVCEKTDIPYEINPAVFLLLPLKGIYLKVTKIKGN